MRLLRKVAKLKRNNPDQYYLICTIGDALILFTLAIQFAIVGFLGDKAGLWNMSSVLIFGAATLFWIFHS